MLLMFVSEKELNASGEICEIATDEEIMRVSMQIEQTAGADARNSGCDLWKIKESVTSEKIFLKDVEASSELKELLEPPVAASMRLARTDSVKESPPTVELIPGDILELLTEKELRTEFAGANEETLERFSEGDKMALETNIW